MGGRETDECILNASVVRDLVARNGLKQWWIADRLQVHRKTVSRWITGSVRRTSRAMARAIAEVLSSNVEEITVSSEAGLHATAADQKAAAESIRRSALLDRLGPIGEWSTIEKLLESALVSGLPAVAREIGESTGEKRVLFPALLNLANISSWNGDTPRALALYETCIGEGSHLEPRELAGALANYGAVLSEAGNVEASVEPLTRAIELFATHGRPTNSSIAHAQMATIRCEQRDYHAAQRHILASADYAERDEYHRGLALAILLEAELDAGLCRYPSAREKVQRGLQRFADLDIEEGKTFEIAARALRLAGDLREADALVDRGLAAARGFPMERAALELERALIQIGEPSSHRSEQVEAHAEAMRLLRRARHLYTRCGAELRARQVNELLQTSTANRAHRPPQIPGGRQESS